MNTLFLLDGHALLYRAYFAFLRRPMVNSKGVDVSAVFGFTKTLIDIILKENPSHLIVGFDPKGKTFRHERYPLYKATRDATPEAIKEAIPIILKILEAFQIPMYSIEGYEADDTLGTLAKRAEQKGFTTYMVTPDKDYGQLVSERIFQYKPGRGGEEREILGPAEICEKYGLERTEQLIDILAIWGDASDNVPGVPGIGEVGAKKLIAAYHSVEGILEHLSELPEKQAANIAQNKEQLLLSRELVTICTQVPVDWDENASLLQVGQLQTVDAIFREYEFHSLLQQLPQLQQRLCPSAPLPAAPGPAAVFGSTAVSDAAAASAPPKHSYAIINQAPVFANTPPALLSVCLSDVGVALYTGGNTVSWIGNASQNDIKAFLTQLKTSFENPEFQLIGHDLKPLFQLFWQEGICFKGKAWDVELMHYLLNPERSHKIDTLAQSYLQFSFPGVGPEIPQQASLFDAVDTGAVEQSHKERCCATAYAAAKLQPLLLEALQKEQMASLYLEVEMPLIGILAGMETEGIRLDIPRLAAYGKTCSQELEALADEIRELCQEPDLKISSPKALGLVLFEKLKLNPQAKRTAGKQYATDEETLLAIADKHPVIHKILDYRSLNKLLSAYIEPLPLLVSPSDGRIHTTFNQSLTATGRLSSQKPNMQNIPIRDERGRELRRVFIPRDQDHLLLSADYSQIELRIMAHLSEDPHFIQAFRNGEDVHRATAAKVFHCNPEEVSAEQRNKAKTANFGIIYGISAFGLAQRLQIPRTEAKALIDEYFLLYPKVREYIERQIETARSLGYVSTLLQRRRYLPDIQSRNGAIRSFAERNAVNAPIQGSAADIIKLAMVRIAGEIKKMDLRSRMILQVHDELVFDTHYTEKHILTQLVKKEMEHCISLKIPLIAECGIGAHWLEAH
jgi:DNA polymerase I